MKVSVFSAPLLFILLCSLAYATERAGVEEVFRHFCKEWVKTKSNHSASNIICTNSDNEFVAEYTTYCPDFEVVLKQNKQADKSYIGVLKYRGTKYKSRGATRDSAVNGRFNRAYDYPVTEIFLYKDGKWHY